MIFFEQNFVHPTLQVKRNFFTLSPRIYTYLLVFFLATNDHK